MRAMTPDLPSVDFPNDVRIDVGRGYPRGFGGDPFQRVSQSGRYFLFMQPRAWGQRNATAWFADLWQREPLQHLLRIGDNWCSGATLEWKPGDVLTGDVVVCPGSTAALSFALDVPSGCGTVRPRARRNDGRLGVALSGMDVSGTFSQLREQLDRLLDSRDGERRAVIAGAPTPNFPADVPEWSASADEYKWMSPSGAYLLYCSSNTFGRGHEVRCADLWCANPPQRLLRIGNEYWEAATLRWSANDQLTGRVNVYPGGDLSVGLTLDVPARSGSLEHLSPALGTMLTAPAHIASGDFSELQRAIDVLMTHP